MTDRGSVEDPLALDVEGLRISFGGVRALKGVDVQVRAGQISCLIGENGSGKSTFVKIVAGVHRPDNGTVRVGGTEMTAHHPHEAIAAGVQVIYQDLSLFDHLTVAENIALNRQLHDRSIFVRRGRVRQIARQQLERIGVELDLDATVGSISVANKQIVAICRALSMDAKVLFMDEPTTALTTREVDRLLQIVTQLKRTGLAIVFISHKLDEIMQVADTVTVFRDGEKVGDFPVADIDEHELSFHMTGRRIVHERYARSDNTADDVLLEVEALSRAGNYEDVSFELRGGDILGITGLLGSGRTELALSLFGLNPPDGGEIRVDGAPVRIASPTDAMGLGLALVPESRQDQGLFMSYSIARNSSASLLDTIVGRFGTLAKKKENELAADLIDRMRVNNRDARTLVGNLSGGNQQKVLIGRGIAQQPSVYILDSPTVGVDIGAKSEIYAQIRRMAEDGMGVIIISDEPEEIVANCNRTIVMHEGRAVAQFDDDEVAAVGFKERLARAVADPDALNSPLCDGGDER